MPSKYTIITYLPLKASFCFFVVGVSDNTIHMSREGRIDPHLGEMLMITKNRWWFRVIMRRLPLTLRPYARVPIKSRERSVGDATVAMHWNTQYSFMTKNWNKR